MEEEPEIELEEELEEEPEKTKISSDALLSILKRKDLKKIKREIKEQERKEREELERKRKEQERREREELEREIKEQERKEREELERKRKEQERREREELEREDILDKFIKQKETLLKKSPKKSPRKMNEPSLEDIPEITKRVISSRDKKSLLYSQKQLGKCFGLFK